MFRPSGAALFLLPRSHGSRHGLKISAALTATPWHCGTTAENLLQNLVGTRRHRVACRCFDSNFLTLDAGIAFRSPKTNVYR